MAVDPVLFYFTLSAWSFISTLIFVIFNIVFEEDITPLQAKKFIYNLCYWIAYMSAVVSILSLKAAIDIYSTLPVLALAQQSIIDAKRG